MALLLPGERPSRLAEVFLILVAVLGLCALGCATATPEARRGRPSVFEAARFEAARFDGARSTGALAAGARFEASTPEARQPAPVPGDESAAFVERALHETGLRFGTDGSPRALWGYLRTSQEIVPPALIRRGDVVFFDTQGTRSALDCADHAGIVDSVSPDGRIAFLEARGGRVRRSFVDPAHPAARRNARGEVLNSFLRPMRVDDPAGARYFSGQMLCGIARVVHR